MTLTISLPDNLTSRLLSQAQSRHVPVDQLAVDLLTQALHDAEQLSVQDDLIKLVEKIRSTHRDPLLVQPPSASLKDLLAMPITPSCNGEPILSPEEWDQAWVSFESEERAMRRANEIAEGNR